MAAQRCVVWDYRSVKGRDGGGDGLRREARAQLDGWVNALAPALTSLRLTLHVLAATVWVGGQLTLAGLMGELRAAGGETSARVARAFARLSWPAFVVLVLTGIWNLSAVHASHATSAWTTVLFVKIVVVALAAVAAGLHQRS